MTENNIKSAHDKANNWTCVPSEDSDQTWQLFSLIRGFAERSLIANDPRFLHWDSRLHSTVVWEQSNAHPGARERGVASVIKSH